jgi:DNA helicase-2/ATP-dependent DNA helicase PcrA
MYKPRPMQEQVLKYTLGKMGVAAVPGAGKTATLSYLASNLIASEKLDDDQEILIVTLVNSAVDNFSSRIYDFLKNDKHLVPTMGYRVRTLHGLAHDIVRERPDLVGISDRFDIIEEREATSILRSIVDNWINQNRLFISTFTNPDINLEKDWKVREQWLELCTTLAGNFIRQAKDFQLTPISLKTLISDYGEEFPLLNMGIIAYTEYQRALSFRSAIDFDDLIRYALKALRLDPDFLSRLRHRWPYILEDEAQDSSRLQEEILGELAGVNGNWVRVGDTNQAIYETFTTADPDYLRTFLKRPDVSKRQLANSGRSTKSIIELANYLIEWTQSYHPVLGLRKSLSDPKIEPSPIGDFQPNPMDDPTAIHLISDGFLPAKETQMVIQSIQRWLPLNLDKTVAVLVPRNERGAEVVEGLKAIGIACIEMLKSSFSTRHTADTLASILSALEDPGNQQKLAHAFKIIHGDMDSIPAQKAILVQSASLIRKCKQLENYLSPIMEADYVTELKAARVEDSVLELLEIFKDLMVRWQKASVLPIDELVLTIAQDIFTEASELALAYKLALLLEQNSNMHPEWSLHDFSEELNTIARNERKFLGFSAEDTGFDPEQYKGKVVVATIHKSKGLEWDRVYLMSVNNYDFPSAQSGDSFLSEKWFIRNQLNLEAEMLSSLKALANNDVAGLHLEEGTATQNARISYSAERLRLFYVGITRARRELIITWNTGRNGNCRQSLPFKTLAEYWESNHVASQ